MLFGQVASRLAQADNELERPMDSSPLPNLRFLHAESTLNAVKLDLFRRFSTSDLQSSLAPGQPGSLKVRADGTILDGHHRISVLAERGEDIHRLPREIIERTGDEP